MRVIGLGGYRSRHGLSAGLSALALLSSPYSAAAEDAAVRAVLFDSLDAGPSVFFNTGMKVAPDRVDREGFAALGDVGSGVRTERGSATATAPTPTLVRATVLAAALGGYQFFYDWGVVGLFAGPEIAQELVIDSGGVRPLPARFGLRAQGELWSRPSEDTLVTMTLILGSARADAYGRISAGYRLWGFYLGPEVAAYADRTGYQKWNAGLHATEVRFGAFTFRLSGGCAYEVETRRAGPYVALAGWISL